MWDLSSDPRTWMRPSAATSAASISSRITTTASTWSCCSNVRARQSGKSAPAEATADWVLASRVRRRVIEISQAELKALPAVTDGMTSEEQAELRNRKYWILATLQE